jgi:hypothetical protein
MPESPPNDMRISCGPSCRRPHKPTLPSFAPSENGARAAPRARPARRLHARVRRPDARVNSGYPHRDPGQLERARCLRHQGELQLSRGSQT